MAVEIIFEAHGTTFDNEAHLSSGHNDVALSPLGVKQSGEMGERYKNDHFDAIFCSDLQRAYKSAEIAFGNKFPITQDARLRECDYGDMTQHPSSEVDAQKPKRIQEPFPNGESYEQTSLRMKDFLSDLMRNYDGKKVMIIGHRATRYGLERWIKGLPLADIIPAPWSWQPGWAYSLVKREKSSEAFHDILSHFQEFSLFTFPGGYLEEMRKLPDDVEELARLIRGNIIHRTTLAAGNTGTNEDLRFGDMTRMPPFRQPEDDYLVTASAMLSELYRLDPRGLTAERRVEDKIVVTCRFVAILFASILKSKGIPARVRSGFAPYFGDDGSAWDHWVDEYWDGKHWVLIDVDGSISLANPDINPFDMEMDTEGSFISAAKAWLDIRKGADPKRYQNAGGYHGLFPAAWELMYDFHSIMGHEITYLQTAKIVPFGLGETWSGQKIPESVAEKIDTLAQAMLDIDGNWEMLRKLWLDEDFRLLRGGLL